MLAKNLSKGAIALLLGVFALVMPLHADSLSLFEASEFSFKTKAGRTPVDCNLKKNADGSFQVIIKNKKKDLVNLKNVQPGKGDMDGSAMMQFDLKDAYSEVTGVTILQDARGRFSAILRYESAVDIKKVSAR